MQLLPIGQKAPEFTLPDQDGKPVSLKDFLGKKVILYFYPKDSTPGCTQQACNLRDHMGELTARGFVVLGVSVDGSSSHRKFIEKQSLPFTLISDTEQKLVNLYGVWGEKSMYGRKYMGTFRVTYVIGEDGTIERIFDKVKVGDHAAQILATYD